MIRIAFVVHGMQAGGIERSVTRIIGGLDRKQFLPFVICLDRSGPAVAWLAEDVPVIEIKKQSGNDISAIIRLRSVLREYQIDIVQSHNWGTLIETMIARKMAGVQAHVHAERGTVLGSVSSNGWRHRLRAIAMKVALTTVDRVMSNAHAVAKRVEERSGYSANQIAIVPNGVRGYSTTKKNHWRKGICKSLGIGESSLVLGSVGRLDDVKGFDVLIDAMPLILQAAKQQIHLILVGGGKQRQTLEKISREKQIGRYVHFVGHQEDVEPWLLAFDIYVNSSRSEGMSQSIVEAMSVGLPIVATDVGDAKQMLSSDNLICGIVCEPEQPHALAHAIVKFSNNHLLRDECGNAAMISHRKRYDEVVFSNSMRDLYIETLNLELPTREMQVSRVAK